MHAAKKTSVMAIINRSSIVPHLSQPRYSRSQKRMNSTQALSEPVANAICATDRQEAMRLTRTAASTSKTRTMARVPTINSMTLSPDTSRSVARQ
jgi:hypothetical protein